MIKEPPIRQIARCKVVDGQEIVLVQYIVNGRPSRSPQNRLFFFNPISYKLEDVSGRSYQELKEDLAPYKDKLDYVPPFEWP